MSKITDRNERACKLLAERMERPIPLEAEDLCALFLALVAEGYSEDEASNAMDYAEERFGIWQES